jgi:hypothetical protein
MTAFEKLSFDFDLPKTSVNQPLSEEFSMRKLWNGEARRAAQTTIDKVVKESTNYWKHFSEGCDHKKISNAHIFNLTKWLQVKRKLSTMNKILGVVMLPSKYLAYMV